MSSSPILKKLHSLCKSFPIPSSSIKIIHSPSQFYNTLTNLIVASNERISLSSLYVGTDELEKKLVDAIAERYKQSGIKITIIVDYNRTTRNSNTKDEKNTISSILKLENSAKISLYQPKSSSSLQYYLNYMYSKCNHPVIRKMRELYSTYHMKIYIIDDTIIISGANLSETYFTNRIDRYIVIKDKNLSDYYNNFLTDVSNVSHELKDINQNYKECKYIDMSKYISKSDILNDETIVYPTFQYGALGIRQDEQVIKELLNMKELCLSSGYLNLPDTFLEHLKPDRNRDVKIIAASPYAHGWYGSKGITGRIPALYSAIEYDLLKYFQSFPAEDAVKTQVFEYMKDGHSFHSKGIWASDGNDFITTIGNRSINGDLETQLIIKTNNSELKAAFSKERDEVLSNSKLANINDYSNSSNKIHVDAMSWEIQQLSKRIKKWL